MIYPVHLQQSFLLCLIEQEVSIAFQASAELRSALIESAVVVPACLPAALCSCGNA